MNICLAYTNKSKYLFEAEELSIIYAVDGANLPAFLKEHQNQIINVVLGDAEVSSWAELEPIFNALAETYSNFYIQFFAAGEKRDKSSFFKTINRENRLKWFTGIPATNWEILNNLIKIGASQVYIAEELGFDAVAAADFCHKNGIKTRFLPNVATSAFSITPSIKKFFIRPEDIHLYEGIADTIEMWGAFERQDAYYKAYKERKTWNGLLAPFFYSFNEPEDIEGDRIHPVFGKARLECRQRCMRPDSRCRLCEDIIEFSDRLKERELRIKKMP